MTRAATSDPILPKQLANPTDQRLLDDYARDLRVLGRSAKTVQSYQESVIQLCVFRPRRRLADMTKTDVAKYLEHVRATRSPATEAVRFRSLRAFFNWMVREEIIERSPLANRQQPKVPDIPIPVPPIDNIRALLKACQADKSYMGRRDEAIIRLMCEPGGPRLTEVATIAAADVELGTVNTVRVHGKGDRWRVIPFGDKTGRAISRYLREREKHPLASSPRLWLGVGNHRAPLDISGLKIMLQRRCREAGVPTIRPHQLRHFAADQFASAGGSVPDAMRLFGWRDPKMAMRYASANADKRAHAFARAAAIGDLL